jgi:hypothetical protein
MRAAACVRVRALNDPPKCSMLDLIALSHGAVSLFPCFMDTSGATCASQYMVNLSNDCVNNIISEHEFCSVDTKQVVIGYRYSNTSRCTDW